MNTWYKNLNKSKLTPPNWIFGAVWPILYCLMGISFFKLWFNDKCVGFCTPLIIFLIQLFFNLIWTRLFFVEQNPLLALLDISVILILTLISIIKFNKIDTIASYLLIPYILWLIFASYLSYDIYIINNTYIISIIRFRCIYWRYSIC